MAVAVAAAATGCVGSETGAPGASAPRTTTAVSGPGGGGPSADPGSGSPTVPVTSGQAEAGPVTGGKGRCVDTDSPAVRSAITALRQSSNGAEYWLDGASDAPLGECPGLLWVRVTAGGSASSPSHLLFFDHDGYLGTATAEPTSYTSVIGNTGATVRVQYRWLVADEPFCCPEGGPAVVTFTLAGGSVTPAPAIPDAVTNPVRPGDACPVDADTLEAALSGTDIAARLSTPLALEDVACAGYWATVRNGDLDATRQAATILFRHQGDWQPIDIGSAVRCTEHGVPAEVAAQLACA